MTPSNRQYAAALVQLGLVEAAADAWNGLVVSPESHARALALAVNNNPQFDAREVDPIVAIEGQMVVPRPPHMPDETGRIYDYVDVQCIHPLDVGDQEQRQEIVQRGAGLDLMSLRAALFPTLVTYPPITV